VGVVTLTGLGLKMANGLIDLAGGYLLPTMFFTMITSLILGMGVPTTANYVITATMCAPALVLLGVPLLAAHLFVFYWYHRDIICRWSGCLRGGGHSGLIHRTVSPLEARYRGFIVPYIFVLNPAMVLIGTTPYLLTTTRDRLRACSVGAAMIGFCVHELVRHLAWRRGLMLLIQVS
jgi:TRAP-type uncharacterized transport system fused permease subunit